MANHNGGPGPRIPHQQPPQQPQAPAEIFTEIQVLTLEGRSVEYAYSQHQVNMGPGGGFLIIQETRGEKRTIIFPMSRVDCVVLTPSNLAAV